MSTSPSFGPTVTGPNRSEAEPLRQQGGLVLALGRELALDTARGDDGRSRADVRRARRIARQKKVDGLSEVTCQGGREPFARRDPLRSRVEFREHRAGSERLGFSIEPGSTKPGTRGYRGRDGPQALRPTPPHRRVQGSATGIR